MPELTLNMEYIHSQDITDILYNLRHHDFLESEEEDNERWVLTWDNFNDYKSRPKDIVLIKDHLIYRAGKLTLTMHIPCSLDDHTYAIRHICKNNPAIKKFIETREDDHINIGIRNIFTHDQYSPAEIVRKLNKWRDVLTDGMYFDEMHILVVGALLKEFYMAEEAEDPFILTADSLSMVKRLFDRNVGFDDIAYSDLLLNHTFHYAYVEEPKFKGTGFTKVNFLNNAIGIFPNFLHYRDNKEFKLLDVAERQAKIVT